MQFINDKKKKDEGNAAPELVIHPLYYELQKKSPFGLLKDWNITEVDMLKDTIGIHQFYTDHLSKSIPLVLRNDASDWEFKKIVDLRIQSKELDAWLSVLFG